MCPRSDKAAGDEKITTIMSGYGPKAKYPDVRFSAAVGGEADIDQPG